MPFGFSFGELVLILAVVVVVFGATQLPDLGDALERFRARQQDVEPPHLMLQRTAQRRWSRADWLLLAAAALSVAIASALLATTAR